MTQAMMPLVEGKNGGMAVSERRRGRWEAKRIQQVNSTMAAASSNHSPAAILHTTRKAIKYNLAAVVGELTHKHKTHRETGNMEDFGHREGRGR